MTTVFHMVRLDFFTLKSQKSSFYMIPFVIGMYCLMDSSIFLMAFTSTWIILIVNTNLFAIQEKYELERLYSSLSITKKIFVLGRYLSATFNFLLSFLLAMLTAFIMFAFTGQSIKVHETPSAFCLSLLTFSVVLAVQLPIYFKFGYSKGRYLSMLPFLIVVFGVTLLPAAVPEVDATLQYVLSHDISFLCLLGSVAAMAISYLISLLCYKK